ncbi:hypothetical protein ACVWXQ_006976 [Bradyrhizobium sp. S3.14.4]
MLEQARRDQEEQRDGKRAYDAGELSAGTGGFRNGCP